MASFTSPRQPSLSPNNLPPCHSGPHPRHSHPELVPGSFPFNQNAAAALLARSAQPLQGSAVHHHHHHQQQLAAAAAAAAAPSGMAGPAVYYLPSPMAAGGPNQLAGLGMARMGAAGMAGMGMAGMGMAGMGGMGGARTMQATFPGANVLFPNGVGGGLMPAGGNTTAATAAWVWSS